MIIAKNIHASNVVPILLNEVSKNTGNIKKTLVTTAVATAKMMTTGQLILSPPKSLSVNRRRMLSFFASIKLLLSFLYNDFITEAAVLSIAIC